MARKKHITLKDWLDYFKRYNKDSIFEKLKIIDVKYTQEQLDAICRLIKGKSEEEAHKAFKLANLSSSDFESILEILLERYELKKHMPVLDYFVDPKSVIIEILNHKLINETIFAREKKEFLLHAACVADHTEAIETLLAKAPLNLNDHDYNHESFLETAIVSKSYAAIHLLLDKGANPNKLNINSEPAYYHALWLEKEAISDGGMYSSPEVKYPPYTKNHLDLIEKLVAKGADLTLKTHGLTPLQTASQKNLEAFTVIKYHVTETTDPLKAQLKAYIDNGFKYIDSSFTYRSSTRSFEALCSDKSKIEKEANEALLKWQADQARQAEAEAATTGTADGRPDISDAAAALSHLTIENVGGSAAAIAPTTDETFVPLAGSES